MIMLTNPATYFLTLIQQSGKNPNFLMSEEYIEKAELVWVYKDNEQGFIDQDGIWYFPKYLVNAKCFSNENVLTGFQREWNEWFWDFEYIYNPKNFLDLSGKKWKIFRKNIKKHIDKPWEYKPIEYADQGQVVELFMKWVDGKEVFDPETFGNFVVCGKNRFGLFLDGELKGVNIADTNFKYINYRFCFDSGELYLNEFLRWKFYTSEWVQNQNKLVNDGGSLGSLGLARFKNKLNPVEILNVYTGVEDES